MKKILSAISGKVAAEVAQTVEKGMKRLTTAEKLVIFGLALIGLSVMSADREIAKKQKDAKTSLWNRLHS